jgi:hypothetical protein
MESHDILERNRRGWIVDKKDTVGPSQIPIALPKNIAWPLDDIQDKDTIICQPHRFLVGTEKRHRWTRRGDFFHIRGDYSTHAGIHGTNN